MKYVLFIGMTGYDSGIVKSDCCISSTVNPFSAVER